MKNFLRATVFIVCTFYFEKAFSQTVNFEVGNGVDAGQTGGDCGDCVNTPDPSVTVRFGFNGASLGGSYNNSRTDVSCGSYGQVNGGSAVYSNTGVAATATITVQLDAKEVDGVVCGGDDGNCNGLATIANSQVINSISPCGWSGQISNSRNGCSSDGSTNNYAVRWYYRWCWNGTGGLSAGSVSGPDQTICTGGDAAAFASSAGPSAQYSAIQWEQSTTSSSSGFSAASGTNNGLTYDPPALTQTTWYRRRIDYCINYSSGALGSLYSNVVTITVVADPSAPTATQSPGATVCTGAVISLTLPTNTAGGTGTPTYYYATSSNSGGTFTSPYTSTNPSVTATTTGTGNYQEKIYVQWSGLGCDASPTTTYSWNTVADPTTTAPADMSVCQGGVGTFTSTPSGGTGALTSQWQYATTIGGTYNNVANATPASWTYSGNNTATLTVTTNATATPGGYFYHNFVSNNLGCNVTSTNATLTVVADPAAPTATKSPNLATVCAGTTLTVINPAFGTGGTGSGSFEYRYSTDGGAGYSAWSSSVPNFAAVAGTNYNIIQIRSNYSGSGCDISGATAYTWTGVPDPTLSAPAAATICKGGTATFSSTASGGTGTYNNSWEYSADGSTGWAPVANGTPVGYTYSATAAATNPSVLTVTTSGSAAGGNAYFRDNLTTITAPTGNGCDQVSANGILTVVDDPTESDPGSPSICRGGSTTLITNVSGGTGVFAFTWQYYNGSSWVALANGVPAGVSYTASANSLGIATNNSTTPTGAYQYRCLLATSTPAGAGCDAVTPTSTVTVVADPTLSAPSGATICKGGSANPSSTVSGGTGVFNLQWNYYNTGTSTWVAVSNGTPTGVSYSGDNTNSLTVTTDNTTTPAGTYQYQLVLSSATPTGGGCDATSSTASIIVVADPAAPAATKSPNVSTVCAGAALTLASITGGGGGTGACNFETRYSTDNGVTWSTWSSGASPTPFTAITGTDLMEVRQNCGGNGCDISNSTQYSWTAVDDPGSPTATKSPNLATVCSGQTLTVTGPVAGANGTGTCNIEYRFSTDNGSSWSSWSTSVPAFAAVAGGNNYIELRENCNGSGCDISATQQYAWSVVADPLVSISPSYTAQCGSIIQTLAANVTGGTGTPAYAWEFDQGTNTFITTGTNSSSLSISLTTPGTYQYRVNYSVTAGAGCDATQSSAATMIVREIPTLSVMSDNCSYNTGSNQEYIINTASGGTPPYTYTTVPGSAVQRYTSANNDVRVYRLPASGSSYSFVIRDAYNCSSSGSVSPTSTVPSNIPIPGGAGSYTYTADCESRSLNEWENYKQFGDNNNVILSVNDQGVDLGTVNAWCYVNDTTPYVTKFCHTTHYDMYGMRRHFKMTSSNYTNGATFPTGVKVRLFFTQAETNDLSTKSQLDHSFGCGDDDDFKDPSGLTDLFVTKYTGTNEDDNYLNNSPSGIYKVYGPNSTNSAYAGPLTVSPGGFQSTISSSNTHNYVELTVDRFSEFWLDGAEHGQALPVKMIYFDAKAIDNKLIRLSWATATEIDNKGFQVERSSDGADFKKIGFVEGNGNSNTRRDYSFDDINAVPNITYYYRLKQIDIDDKFEYSGIVTAKLTGDNSFTVSEFIPNPATSTTRLDIFTAVSQNISLRVFNIMGQQVMAMDQGLERGYNAIQLNIGTLPAGTYSAELIYADERITRRVVINK